MTTPLNPNALLHPDCEITVSLGQLPGDRGYAHIHVSFGLSQWAGVLPIGSINQLEQQEVD